MLKSDGGLRNKEIIVRRGTPLERRMEELTKYVYLENDLLENGLGKKAYKFKRNYELT